MRVLLITHWYKPVKSPVKRMVRIAEHLATNNDVTVLTSLPSYPTGILPKEYQGKLWDINFENKVKVIRVWDMPTPNMGLLKRILNHVMFFVSVSLAVFILEPFDLIIVSSPSFPSVLSGIFAKTISSGKFIFDVRDLWPDSAFELGYKVNRHLKRFLKRLEHFYYRKADKIFTATDEIKRTIISQGIGEKKVVTLVNTVDVNAFKPLKVSRNKYHLSSNEFIVIYVGSLTQVQNLSTAIAAAKILEKENIRFLLVGEGEDKENLIKQTKDLGLKNINFIDAQPTERIVEYMNVSDIGLISLSTNKFFSDNALPTKTSEYLGCGKPIVACAGKTLKELIEKNHVGLVADPGDSRALAKAILKIYKDKKILARFSRNARSLAITQFSDKKFFQVLDDSIKEFLSS